MDEGKKKLRLQAKNTTNHHWKKITMSSLVVAASTLSSLSFSWFASSSSNNSLKSPKLFPKTPSNAKAPFPISFESTNRASIYRLPRVKTWATLDEKDPNGAAPLLVEEEISSILIVDEEVEKSVKVLKNATKTRRVAAEEILSALSILEKAKLDPSRFFDTLGGTSSPGRTWMLIFTAEKNLEKGRYFPLTAIQRFDAAGKRIENGVFLGPIGSLTFEGRISWKKRMLAFIFERIRIKVGPLNPLEINFGKKEEREPSGKDPFFIWFYVDEEIAVARGRSGGTAFWCRCRRVNT